MLAGSISTNVDTPFGVVVGFYSSIAIGANGLPLISHVSGITRDLRVTHCSRVDCNGGTTVVVDPGIMVGHTLRVTRCGNTTCTGSAVSTNLSNPTDFVGGDTSIAIGVDGLPVVSYWDGTALSLRVAKCGTRSCQ